jgi:hypothetical protein
MERKHLMHKIVVAVVLGAALCAGSAFAAENSDGTQAPACKTAEINPVTGHVSCIDPLGAAVEAPPENIKPKCDEPSRGQWTFAPTARPIPKAARKASSRSVQMARRASLMSGMPPIISACAASHPASVGILCKGESSGSGRHG